MIAQLRSVLPWAAAAALAAFVVASCTPWASAQNAPAATGDQAIQGPAGSIYVDDGGGTQGIPVVFLHSFGGDSTHWASALDHVRHHRRAIAIDLRGHGKSAAPRDGDYRVEAFVADLAVVVDTLKLERFVLVGHSLGGAIAVKYASKYPSRVAGLVLVGAPGKVPPEQAQQVLAALDKDYDATMKGYWEKLIAGAQPHVRTQVLAGMDKVPKDESLAIIRALFADDPVPSLERYKGRKLIVYTSQGNTPNDLQSLKPDVPSHEFKGTSHWPHLDRPAEFNAVLDEFLAGVR